MITDTELSLLRTDLALFTFSLSAINNFLIRIKRVDHVLLRQLLSRIFIYNLKILGHLSLERSVNVFFINEHYHKLLIHHIVTAIVAVIVAGNCDLVSAVYCHSLINCSLVL